MSIQLRIKQTDHNFSLKEGFYSLSLFGFIVQKLEYLVPAFLARLQGHEFSMKVIKLFQKVFVVIEITDRFQDFEYNFCSFFVL